ncbi:hypothetical protein N7513_003314 [Penicillium frequentans]|uniref:N-acetyltransferase domain-containing protein n=1 Tax=Penicillium frequentans TaxID=3151616 RepID=A0AAD6CY48_9EURO|nr:hypothetical protein N7494_005319 [Penicillium glabrum]KAJ5557728.1 hypothetical protein N7513_003314 [Penicillium glabrum]
MGDIQLRNITTQSELTPLCSIAAESWLVDPLFNWVVPGLHEYPDDFLTLWKYILKTEFRSTGRHIIVAESPGANGYAAVGFAVWERSSAPTNMEERFSVRTFKNRILLLGLKFWIACQYIARICHKTFSLSRLQNLTEELERVRGPQPIEKWHLQFLGVSPRFQRRGVGKELLQWGIDKADQEHTPIYLEATSFGQPLYESFGFVLIDWMTLDDGRISQAVMRREPTTVIRRSNARMQEIHETCV